MKERFRRLTDQYGVDKAEQIKVWPGKVIRWWKQKRYEGMGTLLCFVVFSSDFLQHTLEFELFVLHLKMP